MLEFINEPVSVEVRLRKNGRALPLRFTWRGRRYTVESWGREGVETRDGQELYCHLVQTPGPESWELCQDTESAQWTISRHWAAKYRVV